MLVPKINGLPLFQPQVIFKRKIYFFIISRLFECYLNFILAETNNPQAELEGAFKFLGPVDKKFIYVQDVFQPKADNPADNVRFRLSFFILSHMTFFLDFRHEILWRHDAFWDHLWKYHGGLQAGHRQRFRLFLLQGQIIFHFDFPIFSAEFPEMSRYWLV